MNSKLVKCKCNKCGIEKLSFAGRNHRRCGGQDDANERPKTDKLPKHSRGKWEEV